MSTTTTHPATLRGRALLRDPRYNRGTAFTVDERAALGLDGLLPAAVLSLDEQAARSYEQYRAQPTDLAKNGYLAALRDRSEVLVLPVPRRITCARCCRSFTTRRRAGDRALQPRVPAARRGLPVHRRRRRYGGRRFRDFGSGADDVDLIVATDAEEILGIGDWGVGGTRSRSASWPSTPRRPASIPIVSFR